MNSVITILFAHCDGRVLSHHLSLAPYVRCEGIFAKRKIKFSLQCSLFNKISSSPEIFAAFLLLEAEAYGGASSYLRVAHVWMKNIRKSWLSTLKEGASDNWQSWLLKQCYKWTQNVHFWFLRRWYHALVSRDVFNISLSMFSTFDFKLFYVHVVPSNPVLASKSPMPIACTRG